MATEHLEHDRPAQKDPVPKRTIIYVYWATMVTSIFSFVAAMSVATLIGMMTYQYKGVVFTGPNLLPATQIVFWGALTLGVLGVLHWAAMIRQKSVNDLRIASMKLELAEMALRSERRMRTIDT